MVTCDVTDIVEYADIRVGKMGCILNQSHDSIKMAREINGLSYEVLSRIGGRYKRKYCKSS
jgi:alanine racemase